MPERSLPPGHAVVLGLGLMGCDIAAIFLAGGWRVTAVEPREAVWPAARERMARAVAQLGGAAAEAQIVAAPEGVDYSDAGVVIEAVPENLAIKRDLFARLDKLVPAGVPVATNASGLRITDIAAGCATQSRMANLHFFLPAHLVPGVEVVRGEHTDQAVCERLAAIMAALGRKPIMVARDVPGFLANRLQHAMMREAFAAIEEGLASADDVDAAVRYTFGFRYIAGGPILQKELAGLETQLAAASSIYPSLNTSPEPSPGLRRLVEAGHYGAKTGQGFREWPPARVAREQARYEKALQAALHVLREADAD
ncbi:3-hydroxyacyl-CoA dehydrogenase family protein [Roseococcus microcysteis]|uniref:3-hydroxyacyl-CoA dehydrogenase family protein n=1 Tax=Roseococcus microcysteis TaxID=2771361 RepID=UPI00168BFAE5|nr:3-hydroxyacyl-CoA dehydrogenase NAD-binding domain-containing protein [Roseococcus microcysteis]